jgi:TetR/AcrR family transcriptional regulator, cholesterol catabolism regulator
MRNAKTTTRAPKAAGSTRAARASGAAKVSKWTEALLPPADRNPTQAAEQRVRQIVHEAARLFDRVGYHNTNMEMVAQAANMRKPTLYHYIKSKEEILLRIHQTLLDDLIARHQEKAAQGLSREELLLGNIADILGHIARNRGYVRAFLEHYRELDPAIRKEISGARQAYFKIVTDLIADGVAAGEYHTEDVNLSALFLLGQVNWAYQWYRPGSSPAPEVIAREILHSFLYGLTRPVKERQAACEAKMSASGAPAGVAGDVGSGAPPRKSTRSKAGVPTAAKATRNSGARKR